MPRPLRRQALFRIRGCGRGSLRAWLHGCLRGCSGACLSASLGGRLRVRSACRLLLPRLVRLVHARRVGGRLRRPVYAVHAAPSLSPLPVSAMGPTGAAWAAGWKEECQPSAIIPSGCPRAAPQRRGAADGGHGVFLPARRAVTGRSLRGDRAGRWEGRALRSSPSAQARRRCARAACCRRTRRSS